MWLIARADIQKNTLQNTKRIYSFIRRRKKAFDELGLDKLPTIKRLNSEYAELLSEKKANYAEYVALQKEVREMLLHKQNYEYILGIEPEKNERNELSRSAENQRR